MAPHAVHHAALHAAQVAELPAVADVVPLAVEVVVHLAAVDVADRAVEVATQHVLPHVRMLAKPQRRKRVVLAPPAVIRHVLPHV